MNAALWCVWGLQREGVCCWLRQSPILWVSLVAGRVVSTRTALPFFSTRATLSTSSREVVALVITLVITFLGVVGVSTPGGPWTDE
jgi:hypothetical protein